MVRGNRANAVQTASAGGIPALVALIDAPPSSTSPMLPRRAMDAWVELGGAPALCKLITHKRPQVAELAAYRVVGLLGHGATATSSGGSRSTAMIPNPLIQQAAVPALLKAGIAGALLKSARSRSARVAEPALMALGALLQVGGDVARVDVAAAGGLAVLSQLTGPPSGMLATGSNGAAGAGAATTASASAASQPLQPVSARGRARGGARLAALNPRPVSAGAVPSGAGTGPGRSKVTLPGAAGQTAGPPSPGVARLAAQVGQMLTQAGHA